ncbi:hypothetical protein [Novosphingobium terrae]|uniref:hypothetical protein n=1 Tax=Novosphingobium terrae TaxID=2726189 RepID=UPI00197DFE73|nr:hypothetical protein [Novosphingobium terrae]
MTTYTNSAAFQVDHAETLDPLSYRVVQLAREEALRMGPPRGVLGRAWQWFVGNVDVARPLANPRLEMLRQFSTLVRLGNRQAEDLAQTMLNKGHYSAGQLGIARVLSQA